MKPPRLPLLSSSLLLLLLTTAAAFIAPACCLLFERTSASAALAMGAQAKKAPVPGTAPWPLPGEIRFDGIVESFLPDESGFILNADKMTMPDGTALPLDPPRPKTILVMKTSLVRCSADPHQKLVMGDLAQGNPVFVVGRNTGVGKALPARLVFRVDPPREKSEGSEGEEEEAAPEEKPAPPKAPVTRPEARPPVKPEEAAPENKPETTEAAPPAPQVVTGPQDDVKPAPPVPAPATPPAPAVTPAPAPVPPPVPAVVTPPPAPATNAPPAAVPPSRENLLKPVTAPLAWRLRQTGQAKGDAAFENGAIKITVAAVDETFWHVQLFHETPNVENGKTYKLSFRAKADAPRRIQVSGELLIADNPNTGLDLSARLTPEWQTFEKTFTVRDVTPGGRHALPNFAVGFQTGTIWIDSVTLIAVP